VRDISLLANRSISFADIKQAIEAENFELLRKVEFVDVYEGKEMADDERSITIKLEYRSNERTLMEEEVEKIHARILQNIESKLDVKLKILKNLV
jgi:phenylalanyl-tRNA synthetase beta chain